MHSKDLVRCIHHSLSLPEVPLLSPEFHPTTNHGSPQENWQLYPRKKKSELTIHTYNSEQFDKPAFYTLTQSYAFILENMHISKTQKVFNYNTLNTVTKYCELNEVPTN